MKSLKNNLLQGTTIELKRLRKCKSELKAVFGIVLDNDEFDNIKWHPVEDLDNITEVIKNASDDIEVPNDKNAEKDENLPNIIKNVTANVSEHEFTFREVKLKEIMDGLLEIRYNIFKK